MKIRSGFVSNSSSSSFIAVFPKTFLKNIVKDFWLEFTKTYEEVPIKTLTGRDSKKTQQVPKYKEIDEKSLLLLEEFIVKRLIKLEVKQYQPSYRFESSSIQNHGMYSSFIDNDDSKANREVAKTIYKIFPDLEPLDKNYTAFDFLSDFNSEFERILSKYKKEIFIFEQSF